MTEEDRKPMTEAELQIQRLLGLKKKQLDTAEKDSTAEGAFVFPEVKQDKTAEKRRKMPLKIKNTLKLDVKTYAKLSMLVKKLNGSIQGTKVSKERFAAAILSRILSDESVFAGADSKEKIEQIIAAFEIRAGGNG